MQLIVRLLRLAADWASDRAHNTTLWGSRVSMDDTFRSRSRNSTGIEI